MIILCIIVGAWAAGRAMADVAHETRRVAWSLGIGLGDCDGREGVGVTKNSLGTSNLSPHPAPPSLNVIRPICIIIILKVLSTETLNYKNLVTL